MIENIIILDTETTGLDPNKGSKLIEVGALLYNLKHKEVLQTMSSFFPCVTNEAIEINHIEPVVTQCKMGTHSPLMFLRDMAKNAGAIVAHNAQFDKKFLALCRELDTEFWALPWVCTKMDFKWPCQLFRNRLQDVCEGMGVPYVAAHRSLNDCKFIADCFKHVEDLENRFMNAFYSLQKRTGYASAGNQYV
jgi:DNA polymerase-3 subunit epsilon